jgi:hypothetical protein
LKLLLDAMFAPEIARQLRRLGHDVVAAKERPDLADAGDPEVFAIAQAEQRLVVTNDVAGFGRLAKTHSEQGSAHFGVLFTSDRRFPRRSRAHVGLLVRALDTLLQSYPGEPRADSLVRWL